VIHTAGVSPVSGTTRQIYEVDLLGTAHVIEAFLSLSGPGTSLVCIASMAGHFARLSPELERHLATAARSDLLSHPEIGIDTEPPQLSYMTAKRGNQLRVQAAARSWGRRGARLNSISPGVVATSMGQSEMTGENGDHIRSLIEGSATRRAGTAEDIAGIVAFLTHPESSYVTGTDLLVDGGVLPALLWPEADNS
jgi:NAD(P)-dependent dehydrogenase (short-subunit alcohol dehydrogenase family)